MFDGFFHSTHNFMVMTWIFDGLNSTHNFMAMTWGWCVYGIVLTTMAVFFNGKVIQ